MKRIFKLFIIIMLGFVLVACSNSGNNTNKDKVAPVYQGMEASSSSSKNLSIRKTNFKQLTGSQDAVDQEDPYNKFDGSTIEDEVKESLEVVTSEDIKYYTTKNQDFFITVKLLNPDNFVILSFTLNGTFYQSYQFQDGSDSENLILKVNSGDASGIKDYTIDAIKYIDGKEIKDVIFAGEKTVKVGVTYDNLPYAETINLNIDTTSVSFNAQVADPAELIALYKSPLKVYLYNGDELIRETDLVVGNNEVSFDKLKQDTLYQYAVVTSYDALDGQGSHLFILDKHAFYTNKMLDLSLTNTTQNSISFELSIDDSAKVGTITSIELYKDSELVKSLTDLTIREFTGLLSNNLYEIKVTYTYDLNDGVGSQIVVATTKTTTKAKVVPTVELIDVLETQQSIGFDLSIIDIDQVGTVTSIELYKDSELVKSLTDLTLREFTGLLSNNLYEIKVTYTYDLNDGAGEQNVAKMKEIVTKLFNGEGSVNNPYQISSAKDLEQLGYYSNNELFYILTNNIELTEISWIPIKNFSGNLNGNGFKIIDLNVHIETDFDGKVNFGLFETLSGTISQIGFIGVKIYVKNINFYGEVAVGVVASENNGNIIDVYSLGNIYTEAKTNSTGGITGSNSGIIKNVFSNIKIISGTENSFSSSVAGYNSGIINSSIGIGNIQNVANTWSIYRPSLAGHTTYYGRVINSFRYENQEIDSNNSNSIESNGIGIVSEEDLNNINFYLDKLNWEQNIWNFSDLNFSVGKFPNFR